MSSYNTAAGKIKNIVIVLLVVSAVFLGWKSRLFGNSPAQTGSVSDWFGGFGADEEDSQAAEQKTEAAKPCTIVVTNAEGDHYGVKYDMDEIGALYDGKAVLIFSEAIGSAPAAERVSQGEWETALGSSGVFFEYLSPVKLSVLAGWYGSEITESWEDFSVRRLCVVDGGDQNRLFFMDEDTGDCYAADTIASGRIADLVESSGINSAFFAFDINNGYEPPGRYTLLLLDDAGHPVVNAVNPLTNEDTLNQVLLNMDISEHESYTDWEGTHIVSEGLTILLKADGTFIYRRTDTTSGPADIPDESEAIELARQQIAGTIAATSGIDADVWFDSIRRTSDGAYEVFFQYVVAGGEVYLYSDGYAASVTVYNGVVTEMELRFRKYTVASEIVQMLPEAQAAAASGGAFMLCYPDNGASDPLVPVWIASGAREK